MELESMVENAKALIRENNLSEAKKVLDGTLAADPSNTFAHFELAKIFLLQGNDLGAEGEYRKVVSLDKEFHEADLELARIFYRQGRWEQALESYRRALRNLPHDLDIYKELSRLCEAMNSPEKALESLKAAAAICPGNTEIQFELARTLRETGNDADAASAFRSILENPSVKADRFFHNKVLNELEITERKEVLESRLRAMIAMVIDRCNIHCRICHIWEGKWQARESIMKEIVDLFPYMEDICWEGGEIFMMKGFDDILAEGTKHANLKQIIFTNGLMISEAILDKISRGRADIVFSIDAVTKETYEYIRSGASWERLLKVLGLVREFRVSTGRRVDTYFNPVIMRTNYRQLMDFVEFGHEYGFNAITLAPIRGEFGDENIFDMRDEEALRFIEGTMPKVMEKAREYGIRVNNWLPARCTENAPVCACETVQKPGCGTEEGAPGRPSKRMICYAPWQRLTIDSGGPARPFAFCLNKFVGSTNDMSLAEIWNGEGMREYRRKIAHDDFAGLCQQECISGQVREKICRI